MISGVDAARVHAGGKNLFNTTEASATARNVTYTLDGKGTIEVSGTNETSGNIFMLDIPNPITIQPGMRIVIDATGASGTHGLHFRNTTTGDGRTINAQAGKIISFDVGANHAGQTFNHFRDWLGSNTEYNDTLKIMFTYSSDNTFEPYTANVITHPLLPDGAPLHGNGTVDDTVENDVLSGCDVKLVFNGSDGWTTSSVSGVLRYELPKKLYRGNPSLISCNLFAVNRITDIKNSAVNKLNYHYQADFIYVNIPGITTLVQLDDYFAANPLTVYYRSTDYTPDKDLRVCKTVRRWKTVTMDGSDDEAWSMSASTSFSCQLTHKPKSASAGQTCDRLEFAQTNSSAPYRFRVNASGLLFVITQEEFADIDSFRNFLQGNPINVVYEIVTPETYMTDPLTLRKPTGVTPVTVTGSSETQVEYPHDTKHYIDSQIAAAVALALNG